jgi:thiamine pyrophosphate-dependent acetolactate synthase large subunit-like protein
LIERAEAFAILADEITDQIVVTGVGSQTNSWMQAKPRPLNLYLRGPMGLSAAVGLGVALAHPDRKVVVLEGDGSLLMGITALSAIAGSRPANLLLVCLDNGVYEAVGSGPTASAGKTDFVRTVQGLGIERAELVTDADALRSSLRECLAAEGPSYLHVSIGRLKDGREPPPLRPAEVKFRFQAALASPSHRESLTAGS